MSYDTPLECGRELANDIKSGLIDEAQLTASGRAKLDLWLASPQCFVSRLSDAELANYADEPIMRVEQEYRAANKKPSVTELLLEEDGE